jgi:hypothetical protein
MNKTVTTIACVIAAVFALMAAAGGQPHGFYQEIRWIIFAVCLWGAYQNSENPEKWVLIGFVVIGVIFNPIIPLHLKRSIWQIIDIATAIGLVLLSINKWKK